LGEYLESTPKQIKLSEPTWTEFLGEIARRYEMHCQIYPVQISYVMHSVMLFRLPSASNQKCVHRFLFQIAEHYKKQKKELDFVFDILKVDVPELFAEVSQQDEAAITNFVRELKKFITDNKLKHKLLTEMKEILVRTIIVSQLSILNLAIVHLYTLDEVD